MKERGLSGSVQMALLLPLALSVLLGTLQWALAAWAQATAMAAVEETLQAAAGRTGTLAEAEALGREVADNGSLQEVTVDVTQAGDRVVARVSGRAVFIVLPVHISQSGERVLERVR